MTVPNQTVRVFEDEMTLMMDNLAPEKTKIVTERKLNIWYNDEIKNQKIVARKKENTWRRNRRDHAWQDFRRERNVLNYLIRREKRKVINGKIVEIGTSYTTLWVS